MGRYTLSFRPSVNVENLRYASGQMHQAKEAYQAAFGNPDSNLFYLEGMDFLSLEGINLLYQLQRDIQQNIPYLRGSYSVITLLPPNTQLPLQKGDAKALQAQRWLRQRALQSPAVAGQLISADSAKALVIMDFETLPNTPATESPYISIGRAMQQLRSQYQDSAAGQAGLKIWGSGAAHIVYQQYSFYVRDLSKIFILLLVVMLLLIFLMLRSWLAFVGTLLSSVAANWLVIAVMSMLGLTVDLTFLMIPVTIGVATAIGYSVHYYNHFKHSLQHTSVDTALAIAWLRCIRPITFTALTTMFSFLSLRLVPIPAIQNTGYACLLEVLIIYALTMTLFPLVLSFTRFSHKYRALLRQNKWAFSYQLEKLTSFSFGHRRAIIIGACLLFVLALYYLSGLRTNYKFAEFMGPKNQVVKDFQYLEHSDFAPIGTVSIVISAPDGLLASSETTDSPAAADSDQATPMLAELQGLLSEMEQEEIVKRVFWLGNLIEDAAALRGQGGGISSIQGLAQLNGLMLLVSRLSGFAANDWLTKDRRNLRILLDIKAFESLRLLNLVKDYQVRLEQVFPGSRAYFTGFIMDTSRGDMLMTSSFIKSIAVSILIVFALLLLIFRRFYITLVSLIPNIFPLVLVGGLISLLGIDLNSFNFLMFPMVIGLIVDDTIHFFYTVVSRFDSSRNYQASIHATLFQVGPALVETTIILSATFSVFLFSRFQGLAYMGLFTVLVILLALLADLILGPICLALVPTEKLRPRKLRPPLKGD